MTLAEVGLAGVSIVALGSLILMDVRAARLRRLARVRDAIQVTDGLRVAAAPDVGYGGRNIAADNPVWHASASVKGNGGWIAVAKVGDGPQYPMWSTSIPQYYTTKRAADVGAVRMAARLNAQAGH